MSMRRDHYNSLEGMSKCTRDRRAAVHKNTFTSAIEFNLGCARKTAASSRVNKYSATMRAKPVVLKSVKSPRDPKVEDDRSSSGIDTRVVAVHVGLGED